MQCQNAQELFSDYIEGQVDLALKVTLENHLAACPGCQKAADEMRSLWTALDVLPREEPPMFFHENLMSRIAQEETKTQEAAASRRAFWDWRSLFRSPALAFGAAFLLLAIVGAETVQTQRAALGPIGWFAQTLRPTPPLQLELESAHASWANNPTQGGTLTVELRTNQSAATRDGAMHYELRLKGATMFLAEGDLPKVGSMTVRVPMETLPKPEAIQIVLSHKNGSGESHTQEVPVK